MSDSYILIHGKQETQESLVQKLNRNSGK